MDNYGSKFKCEHSKYECPYKDCNYHIHSTGKYAYTDETEIPIYLPNCEDEARCCNNNMDI